MSTFASGAVGNLSVLSVLTAVALLDEPMCFWNTIQRPQKEKKVRQRPIADLGKA